MVRRPGAIIVHQPPEGVAIRPWSAGDLNAAARILFENAFPGDKAFHRPYRTLEGCRDYLNAVIGDRYGHFLPELSFVSCRAGLPVGQLLTAIVPRSGIVIVDLAVDRELRGLGIASALLSHLIEANETTSREDIMLTVTRSNLTAFRLYQRLGFQIADDVGYFIYGPEGLT